MAYRFESIEIDFCALAKPTSSIFDEHFDATNLILQKGGLNIELDLHKSYRIIFEVTLNSPLIDKKLAQLERILWVMHHVEGEVSGSILDTIMACGIVTVTDQKCEILRCLEFKYCN